jgi:23S rRNA (guanosine2251-2'-O)-methyltransferase
LKHFLSRPARTNRLVLLLDEITDPHNLGAILRSADQFSVDLVVIPQSHSVKLTGSVAKVSSGASAWVATCPVTNLLRAMEQLKKAGYWLYGADKEGERADSVDLAGNIGIVMGSEGKGLRRLVMEGCDGIIRIPSSGHVDSFNVSVAAGILMYEVRRQQGYYSAD